MFELGKKGESSSREADLQRSGPAKAEFTPAPRRPAGEGGRREAAVIGPSIHIDGDLRGEEDLLIDGEVNGTVQLKNNSLTIGGQGKIRADVYANSIYVEGFIEGDLYGSERVSIGKTAQVRGKITSPRVSLEEGATFKGSIEMDPEAVQAAVGPARSAGKQSGAPVQAPPAKEAPGTKPDNDSLLGKAKPVGSGAAAGGKV